MGHNPKDGVGICRNHPIRIMPWCQLPHVSRGDSETDHWYPMTSVCQQFGISPKQCRRFLKRTNASDDDDLDKATQAELQQLKDRETTGSRSHARSSFRRRNLGKESGQYCSTNAPSSESIASNVGTVTVSHHQRTRR